MEYKHITVETEDHLAIVTIRREKALNALSSEVLSELTTAAAELELDDAIAAVCLTGAGDKAFVAGADISEMVDLGPLDAQALSEMGANLGNSIETSAKPWIAAVNGFALGGGCELALACDFIYASTKAKLGQPEVKLGVIPGFGGTQRLPRRVGVAKAKELIFTGDVIGADEALRIGLVDAVVAPEELMAKVRDTAGKIANNGPVAVAEAKRLIHVGQSMSLEASILLEERSFGGLFDTDDQSEGMRAFLDKRAADFQGK
jgi:enoyl-CoA hydratase